MTALTPTGEVNVLFPDARIGQEPGPIGSTNPLQNRAGCLRWVEPPPKHPCQSAHRRAESAAFFRDRISTDRMVASEAADVGSIPAGPATSEGRQRAAQLLTPLLTERSSGFIAARVRDIGALASQENPTSLPR